DTCPHGASAVPVAPAASVTANGQGGGGDGRALPGEGAFVTGVSTPVKRTYSNTSRQARIAWKPVKDLRIRATWGESFLTPQVQQQFGLVYIDDRTFSVGYYGRHPAGRGGLHECPTWLQPEPEAAGGDRENARF